MLSVSKILSAPALQDLRLKRSASVTTHRVSLGCSSAEVMAASSTLTQELLGEGQPEDGLSSSLVASGGPQGQGLPLEPASGSRVGHPASPKPPLRIHIWIQGRNHGSPCWAAPHQLMGQRSRKRPRGEPVYLGAFYLRVERSGEGQTRGVSVQYCPGDSGSGHGPGSQLSGPLPYLLYDVTEAEAALAQYGGRADGDIHSLSLA